MTEELSQYMSLLNEEQLCAVKHEGSPLLILAGAGSGKTRVITTKIAYLIQEKNIEPFSILAVTFTKKAATEMKERAVKLESRAEDAQIRTFHSFGAYFLRCYAEQAGLAPNFTVYDDDDVVSLIKEAVPGISDKEAGIAAKQISLAKDYFLEPEDDLSIIKSDLDISAIYLAYQKKLRATGNADFGDLIMLPVKVMENYKDIASYIHNRFKVIMVDEYQDSNIAQYKFLQCISGVNEDSNTYVCVVGDDDQSIYKFRGAEVQNILTFGQKFKGTTVIKLERNYRSTAQILNAAQMVVSHNSSRLGKNLVADRGEGSKPVLTFLPSIVPRLELQRDIEASFCADLIQKSVEKGTKYSDWAILYRTNAQSRAFETEFVHTWKTIFKHAKIPYRIIGSLKFFDREEVKDTLAYLSLVVNPKDAVSFKRIVKKFISGVGPKTQAEILQKALIINPDGSESYENLLESIEKLLPEFSKKAKEGCTSFVNVFKNLENDFEEEKTLASFIQKLVEKSGLRDYYKEADSEEKTSKSENIDELISSASGYKNSIEGLIAFLDAVNLDRAVDTSEEEQSDDYVTLITLHNTKGLEFNRVIITGLEEGVFPREDKIGMDLEEERRLFYVGITRAKNELYITCSAKRFLYGSWRYTRPSPFLTESASAFTAIGQIPLNFGVNLSNYFNAEEIDSQFGELKQKWKKGTKLFHDDYGYGIIINASPNDGEYVIEVQFETGNKKKFLPQYQAKSLTVIKD